VQVAEITEQLNKYKKRVKKFGVSMTTDAWDDNSRRHLHNCMVVTSAGGMSEDHDRCFSTMVLGAFSTGAFQHQFITPH
jgi:hypothetical protein